MSRPKKEGLDYFPVDVDFDEKVDAIIMLHQNDGLSWVIRFWQKAYKTLTGIVDFSGLFAELFANKCRISKQKHSEILETALKVEFCYEIEADKYTSHGIQRRIASVSKERSDAIERQKESTKEKKKRKEKNSIVKESKVKECPTYSSNNNRIITEESNDTENINQNQTWRGSFQVYLSILSQEFLKIRQDLEWIERQERFNPNVDIILSVEKMIDNFWGKESGWKNKKSKRDTKTIDWPATFANNLSNPSNRVYKQRQNTYGKTEYTKEKFQEQMEMRLE